ncbi:MAG TPA: thiolase family protein, partial [Bacteroidales bacterium]|nr:thiolase family protein [Bacteroidales bacterium]
VPGRKGETVVVDRDEEYTKVSFEKIPSLKPVFIKDGTITAANASTINDGAAALVLMSREKAESLGLKPLAIIRGYADAAQAPAWFTTAPAIAVPLAIQKAGLRKEDIAYYEVNEAFAVVSIAVMREMGLDPSVVNIHGSGVSLGHPLGSTGARILVSLVHILHQKGARYGAAGLCNGGGGASAMVIENPGA